MVRKWRELSELREMDEPKVRGARPSPRGRGLSMRSADFAHMLSRFRGEEGRCGTRPAARLMLCGPATDEVEWFEEIERLGAVVVADASLRRAFTHPAGEGPPRTAWPRPTSPASNAPACTRNTRGGELIMETAQGSGWSHLPVQ